VLFSTYTFSVLTTLIVRIGLYLLLIWCQDEEGHSAFDFSVFTPVGE